MITEKTTVVPSWQVAFRRIGGKTILVHPGDKRVLTLNDTGSIIWALLNGRSVDEVASTISFFFEVTHDQALRDAVAFLDQLVARGLAVAETRDACQSS